MRCLFLTSFGKEGYGHLTRCIAMSQAFDKLKINNSFLLNKKSKLINYKKIYRTYDWYKYKKKTINLIKKFDFVILDSIRINQKYLFKIKKYCKLFYINDYHRWIVKDAIHIDWTLYAKKNINDNEIIDYKLTPLRKPFWSPKKKLIKKKIKKILIFFGGSDIRNLAIKVTKLIREYNSNYTIDVISKKKIQLKKVTCHNFLDQKKISNLFTKADAIVTSGGQTLYEMACFGVPGVVISESKYDLEDVIAWKKKGSIIFAGRWKDKNIYQKILNSIEKINQRNIRLKLSKSGQKMIDGRGGLRLAEKILKNVRKNF